MIVTRQRFSAIFFGILIILLCYENVGCSRASLIGKPLPEFSLPPFQDPVTGQSFLPVNSQLIKGRKTLIVVWASWCRACRSLHPQLMDLARTREWRIVGIIDSSDPTEVGAFLRENGNPYFALSPREYIKGLPLGNGVPLIYAISAKGIILGRELGAPISPDMLAMN